MPPEKNIYAVATCLGLLAATWCLWLLWGAAQPPLVTRVPCRPSMLARAIHWLRCRRVCAWCGRRLGGNPLSRTVTHGLCWRCLARERAAFHRRAPQP